MAKWIVHRAEPSVGVIHVTTRPGQPGMQMQVLTPAEARALAEELLAAAEKVSKKV